MPAHIMLEDAIYLTQKGAMTIPPKPLRDDLLRAYSDHVHPVLPFIELSEFLRIVRLGDPSSGSISLLLFQAVMFAATGSVDIDSLREAGFTTRKAARKFFYRRVKLLYDFDYEVNRLTIVKALLLMTLWDQSPDDHKGSWYWMGIAASLAFSIGLPREQECAPSFQNDKRCRKRLWWSLVVRDRLIALEMRRRPHIGAEVSETPMISIDDFTIASLQEVIPGGPSQSSLARDVEMQHQAAITFIATAELSSCIAWMLSSYRSTLGYSHAAMREQDQKPKSKQSRPKAESFEPCEEHPDDFGLANWLEKLPFQARHHTPTQGEYRDSQIPIIIQRAVLRMLFNSSLIHLHDPEAVFSASCSWSDSRQTVKHHVLPGPAIQAASEITSIAQDLRGLGLINILPSTGASALLSAANTHLLNLKFSVGDHQRASLREFARCMQILIQLRETYASVETAVHLLEDTIRKEEIDVNQDTTRDAHHLMTRGHPASDMLFKSGRRLLDQPQIPTFTEHHPRMSSSDRLPSDTTPPSSQPSDGQNPEVKTLHSCRTLITPPSSDSDSRSQSVNTAADSTSHNQDRLTLTTPLELDSESPSSFGSLVDLEVEGEIEPLFPLISADMGRTMDAGDAKGADDGLLVAMEWMREMDHEEGVGSAVMVGGVGY
ncbi:MAG: hypothetical protein M1817_006556 [Caeruleum heppii]|nr:MAG: hypothetical protein M1817_006556 [Caeruleum heppii]